MDITMQRIVNELTIQKRTQVELADFIGVTSNVITDWKSGRIRSYTKYIHGIADFLGVSVEYLKGETDEKYVNKDLAENVVRIAGRNGEYIEKRLTDEQVKALKLVIEQLPEASDEL